MNHDFNSAFLITLGACLGMIIYRFVAPLGPAVQNLLDNELDHQKAVLRVRLQHRGIMNNASDKSLESWIWDAACSIRGAQEAPKFKDFILPLIFTKRLCDVFDDELNRIAVEVGSRAKAFKLVERDHKLVRFYLPLNLRTRRIPSGRSSASSPARSVRA